jgi:hypothetical protein
MTKWGVNKRLEKLSSIDKREFKPGLTNSEAQVVAGGQ